MDPTRNVQLGFCFLVTRFSSGFPWKYPSVISPEELSQADYVTPKDY